jgi:hypothetical protein
MQMVTMGSYHYPIRGLMAMAAGTMMLVSISIMMSFANLNTYIISYMRDRTDPTLTYAEFIFISQGRTLVSGTMTYSITSL